MKSKHVDICIVGGGAIALIMAVFQRALFPKKNIAVIAGSSSNLSASSAAGAMLNVVSEIDYMNSESSLTNLKIKYYSELFDCWKYLESILSPYLPSRYLLFGTGTEIRLDQFSTNDVERKSFEQMHSTAVKCDLPVSDITSDSSFLKFNLPKEQSVDSNTLLSALRSYLIANNVLIVYEDVVSLDESNIDVEVKASSCTIHASSVIIAAGVYSDKIIRFLKADTSRLIPSYYGIGSALLLDSEFDYVKNPKISNIVRTPNRGGTCGIHAVKRSDCLYVGASSMTVAEPACRPRAESIETLLMGCKKTLHQSLQGLSMQVVTGYRPTTLDTYPIVGSVSPKIYTISGTKRDGLTWAPMFAKSFSESTDNSSEDKCFITDMSSLCFPFRKPISFGDHGYAIDMYVTSKIAESSQHSIELTDSDIYKLRNVVSSLHSQLPSGFSIHPELVNIFAFNSKNFNHLISLL